MQKQIHIAFVDPFSSTEFLANSLKAKDIRTSVIYTQTKLNNSYITLQPDLFNQAFYLNSEEPISEFIATLEQENIDRIYYGNEISVATTDQLAAALCPSYANPLSTAAFRSDKFAMQQALQLHGMPSVEQISVISILTPAQEKELENWQFPVIIKPTNSAASVGVELCDSLESVRYYLQNHATTNLFGQAIPGFAIQKYLQGTEYFIDTFSDQGKVFLSGIQRYQRKLFNGAPICLFSETVAPDSPEAKLCFDFVCKTLKAVDLNHGFAHTEVMLTPTGPYLIEVNPRISGGYGLNNKLFQICGLPAQVDLLIASIKQENMPIANAKYYSYGRKVLLQNYAETIIKSLNVAKLKTLTSFREALMLKTPGTKLFPAKNLTDVVGLALLAHTDAQQVLSDYDQLISWEAKHELF